jgi:hypothetical protein
MPRQQQGRHERERGYRREPRGRYSSEGARRNVRDDDRLEGAEYDEERDWPSQHGSRETEEREFRQDERGRYRTSGRRDETGYGNEWPESYRSDFSGQAPRRYRDSWSERQSGPYRSPVSGRNLSEDDYRQEAHWHRSRPYTGFSGRVSGFGFEDPGWSEPQMGRTGGATRMRYPLPREGFEGLGPRNSDERIREDICDELSDGGECDARNVDIEVKDGIVTLSDTVPERYMKHRAEDIADNCRGVRDVENQIRVQKSGTEDRSASSEGGSARQERAAKSAAGKGKNT